MMTPVERIRARIVQLREEQAKLIQTLSAYDGAIGELEKILKEIEDAPPETETGGN